MPGMENPLLTPGLIRDLHSLNLRFLRYVGGGRSGTTVNPTASGLSAGLVERIGALDVTQLREVAACPCTLFAVDWAELTGSVADISGPAADRATTDGRLLALATALVVFATQLARRQPLAARIVLGCQRVTVSHLSGLPLGAVLDRLAEGSPVLRARYLGNRRFWPDLLTFAECEDARRLEVTRSLAVQLSVQAACRSSRDGPAV